MKDLRTLSCFLLSVHNILCLPAILEQEQINEDHTVVLFVFSGLRSDSLRNFNMPTLNYLRNHGVYVQRKIDAFQTESLPSFITLLTGNYPESHGIMSNRMKNLITKESFDATITALKWWKNVEPVWVTNDRNGSTSALCYVPGHDVMFDLNRTVYTCGDGKYTDPYKDLWTKEDIGDTVMPFSERISFVKSMLNMTNNRPSLIAVYFEEPYYSIMRHGLWSTDKVLLNEAQTAYQKVENATNEMFEYLTQNNLLENVNFIVTGESGFTEQPEEKFGIFLDDYLTEEFIEKNKYTIIDDGPIMQIDIEDSEAMLKQLQEKHKHMLVLDGKKLPSNFHFTNVNLTAPIIIVSDERWRVYNKRVQDNRKYVMGYDGKYESTHTLFLAHGPAFNHGLTQTFIGNVDIYTILCEALKIKPSTNSGNNTTTDLLMRKPKYWIVRIVEKIKNSPTGLIAVAIVATILLFTALYLLICSLYRIVGRCVCPRNVKPLKVKIQSSRKLYGKNEKLSEEYLLAEKELSSDFSDADDDLGYGKKYGQT